jgi:hypothetical protein
MSNPDFGSMSNPDSGSPPHVVGNCEQLPGVDQLENITPPGVAKVLNVITDPVHGGTIYVGSEHAGIFKSIDCGSNWQKVDTGRAAAIADSGNVWYLQLVPNDPDTLYWSAAYSMDSGLYKSTNGGADSDSLFPAGGNVYQAVQFDFFQWASMEPNNFSHVLVCFHADCSGPTGRMCMAESTDGGANWRLFKGPVDMWREGAGPYIFGPQDWLYMTAGDGVFHTTDGGNSWHQVMSIQGLSGQTYQLADGTVYFPSAWGIYATKDGESWSPVPNSPIADALIGDGKRLFTGRRTPGGMYLAAPATASDAAGTRTWTQLPTPATMTNGAVFFAYDPDHHLLYSANIEGGLWRMATY